MQSARPYLAAFRARFQLMLQYRAAALAGFATQVWWGALRIMIFAAFYGVHAAAAPISLADAVTYVWLGQALLALLATTGCGRSTPTASGMRAPWDGCLLAPCRARC